MVDSIGLRRALSLRTVTWCVAVALAAVGAGACSEAADPVVRVQPNALEKKIFEGDWYYRQTVIDTPYSAGYSFVGEQGSLSKIRWEIQENYLIARRVYEFITGSEGEGISGSDDQTGTAIAMYAIESHFDIRREYNPTTGEEINVVSENSSDRPWNQRTYMRIDWSQNLITDSDFLALARVFDGIEAEPVAYYVQDPNNVNAPKFVKDEESSKVEYIDIVNKMFIRPTTVHIDGLGPVPSCYLLYKDHLDCAPGEMTVRNSFLRVDETREYQPQIYTGDRMERFGYFVTDRPGYDPHYGVVDAARHRFVNRHNLWERSFKRDSAGALVRCANEEADCGGDGSVCDMDWARAHQERQGVCTLPFRERKVRPIVYYLSENFPEALEADAQHLSDSWNGAFKETIASLRENECLADGGDATTCAPERERADGQAAFVLCHSPVRESDSTACGPRGTVAAIGDLRYSLIGWVAEPHLSSPLGYGPSAADPQTGELIQGNAFVYGAGVNTLASFARDIVGLLNGDIEPTDITSGEVVDDWVVRMTAPGSEVTGRPADDHTIAIDGYDAERINAAMDFSWVDTFNSRQVGQRRPSNLAEAVRGMRDVRRDLARNGAFGDGQERGMARLRNLRGTDIEAMLTGSEMRAAAGIDPSLPVNDAILDAASPIRGMNLGSLKALENARRRVEEKACILRADFADDGMLGLARAIKEAASSSNPTMTWYGHEYRLTNDEGDLDYEAVRSMLMHPIFDAVTAHEVGHTVGLRHNFSGSYDALNYHPRYWELRDDGNMQPRAWDPLTANEINGRIREYQYSTVMDYGNNFVVTDSEGIGHYDYAAVKMGYGDLVEVFSNAADQRETAWISIVRSLGWPADLRLSSFTGDDVSAHPYTELPSILGGIDRVEQRADVPYTSLRSDRFFAAQGLPDAVVDAQGRPIVPYMFCSDEQADLGFDCFRYDAGADPYETLQSVMDTYWNYYVFNAFRRQRVGFNTESYARTILGRYFEKLQSANQSYGLYRAVFDGAFSDLPGYDQLWTRRDGLGAHTVGVGAAYQMLTRVVTAPEPGNYAPGRRSDGSDAMLSGGGTGGGSVGIFDGRFLETTWDFDAGYFWFDKLDRVGYFYDKALALQVLTDPTTHFLGEDTDSDVRRYKLSFYTTFGPSLTGFFRGLLADDWKAISPRIGTNGELRYPDPLELEQGDMSGRPLDPNASFSIQLYAAVFGLSLIPETFDQTFMDRSRIFVRGGAEGVDIDPSVPTVEFTDPQSGLTYVAASYLDTEGRELGVGAQMLGRAQLLADQGATRDLRSYIDNLNVMRRLTWLLGFGG